MEDYRKRIERALSGVRALSNYDAGLEIQLLIALALSMRFVKGGAHEAGDAWAKPLELAEVHEDSQYRLRALWGHLNARGEMRAALTRAEEFSRLAAFVSEQADPSSGEKMMGVSHHYLGNQTAARHHIERML
jgi:hypothetical protein